MKKVFYHVFVDNNDAYFDTQKIAIATARKLKKDGERAVRVYKKVFEGDEILKEDCIYSYGGFPY